MVVVAACLVSADRETRAFAAPNKRAFAAELMGDAKRMRTYDERHPFVCKKCKARSNSRRSAKFCGC